MSKTGLVTEADLPAPLSLTLDDVRNVAGGTSYAISGTTVVANLSIPHWWWFGQWSPVANTVNQGVTGVNVGPLTTGPAV